MSQLIKQIPSITVLYAPPRCGKSHLIKHLVYSFCKAGKFNHGIVFCPTGGYDFMPDGYVHSMYSDEMLSSFMSFQKRNGKPAFLIFDDCLGMINPNSKVFTKLFTTYRHYNITILITAQYVNKLPPVCRDCATYVFVFKQFSEPSFIGLHKAFFPNFDDWKQTKAFVEKNTGDHKFIIVDTLESPERRYSVSKAPSKIPNFKLSF